MTIKLQQILYTKTGKLITALHFLPSHIPEFSSRVPTSVRISRQDFELSSFPEKLLTVSSNEASFLQEEMERKKSKQMNANNRNKNVENDNNGSNSNSNSNNSNSGDNNNSKSDEKDKDKEKKIEIEQRSYSMSDCVLSPSVMLIWGYPIPPTLPCSTSIPTSSTPITTTLATSTTTSKSESLPQEDNSFGENLTEKRSRDENTDSENGNISKKVRTESSEETVYLSENKITGGSENNQENSDEINTKLETKNEENVGENSNHVEVEVEAVWSDESPIGATVGLIPTIRETKSIFNIRVLAQGDGEDIGSGIEGLGSVELKGESVGSTHCVDIAESGVGIEGGGEGGQAGTGVEVSALDTPVVLSPLPPLPPSLPPSIPLLYPSFEPLIQSTRGPLSRGPGVMGYRETVSQFSKNFKTLWMTPTVCTANART